MTRTVGLAHAVTGGGLQSRIGGDWYFYPAPVYPYPDPYEPPVTVAAAPPAAPAAAPVPKSWYYCEAAKGYYPTVPACPGGWKPVPANPVPPGPSGPAPQ